MCHHVPRHITTCRGVKPSTAASRVHCLFLTPSRATTCRGTSRAGFSEVAVGGHGTLLKGQCECRAKVEADQAKHHYKRRKDLKELRVALTNVKRFVDKAHALRTREQDDVRATCVRLSAACKAAAAAVHPTHAVKCETFSTGAVRTANNAMHGRITQNSKATKGSCAKLVAEFVARALGQPVAQTTCCCNRCSGAHT